MPTIYRHTDELTAGGDQTWFSDCAASRFTAELFLEEFVKDTGRMLQWKTGRHRTSGDTLLDPTLWPTSVWLPKFTSI